MLRSCRSKIRNSRHIPIWWLKDDKRAEDHLQITSSHLNFQEYSEEYSTIPECQNGRDRKCDVIWLVYNQPGWLYRDKKLSKSFNNRMYHHCHEHDYAATSGSSRILRCFTWCRVVVFCFSTAYYLVIYRDDDRLRWVSFSLVLHSTMMQRLQCFCSLIIYLNQIRGSTKLPWVGTCLRYMHQTKVTSWWASSKP
jgi:hypothetical protein